MFSLNDCFQCFGKLTVLKSRGCWEDECRGVGVLNRIIHDLPLLKSNSIIHLTFIL